MAGDVSEGGGVGGITELGEYLEDTAIREAKEETNLDIEDITFLGTTSGKDCYIEFPSGDKAYFITIGYYTKFYAGKLKIDNVETKELRFFSYEGLPENIPNSHRKMLDKYYMGKAEHSSQAITARSEPKRNKGLDTMEKNHRV